jgi:hypothetical protein
MDRNRHEADSEQMYSLYFDLLEWKISEYSVLPNNTYNMDEKGFMIGKIGRSKRVFSRALWESKQVKESLQDSNREWVSVLACIGADGTALPPGVIFEGLHGNIRDTWVEEITEDTPIFVVGTEKRREKVVVLRELQRAIIYTRELSKQVTEGHVSTAFIAYSVNEGARLTFVTSSPTGWSNDDIGVAWLELVFDRFTKEKAGRCWRLLLLDGHGSHITWEFLAYYDRNRILLMIYPPYATHSL